jgi:hypothetical protein
MLKMKTVTDFEQRVFVPLFFVFLSLVPAGVATIAPLVIGF